MALGPILPAFHLVEDGAVTAPLPGTKVNFRRKTFWKHFATWDMRAVVRGLRRSDFGTRYDSRFPLRTMQLPDPSHELPRRFLAAFLFFATSANKITGPLNMVIWNSI